MVEESEMTDIVEAIADCLLEDHWELMQENARLRHELDEALKEIERLKKIVGPA